MRVWIMIGIGVLMFATVALPSGARGASVEDVRQEVAKMTPPPRTNLQVWIPLIEEGGMHVPLTDLCVSGDRVRRKGVAGPSGDMGKVEEGNEYHVLIIAMNPVGDPTIQSYRHVSLPNCQ